MSNEIIKSAIGQIVPMIAERLKEALNIANTANACAATGNPEAALRVFDGYRGINNRSGDAV